MTVAAILKQKGSDVATIPATASIAEVATLLAHRRIGAVLVRDPGGELAGIVSERDIVRALATHGAATMDMTADRLMTRALKTAAPSTTVPEATALMTEGRFRHLPVLDQGRLVGIISIGDVVKARMSQQDHEVDSLKAYVAGVG